MLNNRSGYRRRGAVLIFVMVLLLIVGLLASQSMQTLLLIRRGDDQREQVLQAREVLELGAMVLQQSTAQTLPAESLVTWGTAAENTAKLRFESLPATTQSATTEAAATQPTEIIRITTFYPVGTTSEISASQLVSLQGLQP